MFPPSPLLSVLRAPTPSPVLLLSLLLKPSCLATCPVNMLRAICVFLKIQCLEWSSQKATTGG